MGFPKNRSNEAQNINNIQMVFLGGAEYEIVADCSYRPFKSNNHMHKLWILKHRRKRPNTKWVAEALDIYFDTIEKGGEKMAIKATVNAITVKDENTGEVFKVHTLRTAREIVGFILESEKGVIAEKEME